MGPAERKPILQGVLWCALACSLLPACDGCSKRAPQTGLELTTGVMTGEADDHSAVVWGRGTGAGWLQVEVAGPGGQRARSPLAQDRDFTARIQLSELKPSTDYAYKAWLSLDQDGGGAPASAKLGAFRTAPAAKAA
ncbi:MAG: hypothetical protein AB7K71_37695, partial [Polyangiaceae bacterium]